MTAPSTATNVAHHLDMTLDEPHPRWITLYCNECSWKHAVHRCTYVGYTAPLTCTRAPDPR